MQYAIGCESIHTDVDEGQLPVWRTAGVRRDQRDQFIAAHNRKPPSSTKAIACTVRNIEHHEVDSSEILADKFGDKRPQELMAQALKTLEEAMESYMVEVTADPHSRSSN